MITFIKVIDRRQSVHNSFKNFQIPKFDTRTYNNKHIIKFFIKFVAAIFVIIFSYVHCKREQCVRSFLSHSHAIGENASRGLPCRAIMQMRFI